MKISIVVPTYKRARVLSGALDQLLSQTLTDFELLVMDDGSPDDTAEVVARIHDPRLHYHRYQHLGVPQIVIEGMLLARGEYLIVCHDHDLYHPELLQELAGALDRHPSASFAHSGVIIIDPTGSREIARYIPDYPELSKGQEFLEQHLLPGIASPITGMTLIRRSALEGRYLDPRFGPCADVELWLRLCRVGDVAYVKRPLLKLRERDASSEFFHRSVELAQLPLSAKRLYLRYVSQHQQHRIRRTWRREVDRTGLALMLRALEHQADGRVSEVLDLVRTEGSRGGTLAMQLLRRIPRPATLQALRSARWVTHRWREMKLNLASGEGV